MFPADDQRESSVYKFIGDNVENSKRRGSYAQRGLPTLSTAQHQRSGRLKKTGRELLCKCGMHTEAGLPCLM